MKQTNRALLICWLAMITIFSLDVVSTIIGVEMFGLAEMNIFAAKLFTFGLGGYLLVLIIYAIFFLSFLKLIGVLHRFSYKRITNKELNDQNEISAYCFIASVYVLLDAIVVMSNFLIMFS